MNLTHLPLTKKESDILAFIYGYIDDNKYSPTRQEIADHISKGKNEITSQGVSYFINQLVAKHKLKLAKNRRRNIIIV